MKRFFTTLALSLSVLSTVTVNASDLLIREVAEGFQILDFKPSQFGPFEPAEAAKVLVVRTKDEAVAKAVNLTSHDWDEIVNKHQLIFKPFVHAVENVAQHSNIAILSFTSRIKAAGSLKNKAFDRIIKNTELTFIPGQALNDMIGVRLLVGNELETKALVQKMLEALELRDFSLNCRPSYDNINYAITAEFKDIPYLGINDYKYPSIGEIQIWTKSTGMWLNQQHDNVYKGYKSTEYYKNLLKPFTNLHLFVCRILSMSDFQTAIEDRSVQGIMKSFDNFVLKMPESDYFKKLEAAFWGKLPEDWKRPNGHERWMIKDIQQKLNQLEVADQFDLDAYFVLD